MQPYGLAGVGNVLAKMSDGSVWCARSRRRSALSPVADTEGEVAHAEGVAAHAMDARMVEGHVMEPGKVATPHLLEEAGDGAEVA